MNPTPAVPASAVIDLTTPAARTQRDTLAARTDVLDKVKVLSMMPDDLHVTREMVATYFEVDPSTIEKLVQRNRDELQFNGLRILRGQALTDIMSVANFDVRIRALTVFTRRTVLDVAMLLRDSPVARQVRSHLLDVEQAAVAAPALTGPALLAAAVLEAQSMLAEKDAVIDRQVSQIMVMAPKADYVDMFVATDDLIEFRTLANQLTIKECDLRGLLIGHSWIYMYEGTRWSNTEKKLKRVRQYRAHADKNRYFRLGPEHEAPRVQGKPQQTLFLTPDGAVAVAKAVRRWTERTDLLGLDAA